MDRSKDMFCSDGSSIRITPVQQVAAACTGAFTTSLIMTPLDVVKVRLQTQQQKIVRDNKDTYKTPGMYNGIVDTIIKIARKEGMLSLWSGLSPTLILAVPGTIIYFVTYEQLSTRLNDQFGDLGSKPTWVPFLSGCTARLLSATTVSPLELIRTKMQSKKLSYLQVSKALQDLVHTKGYKGLWKGLSATLCRDVPFSGIYWVSYESMKTKCPDSNISFWFFFLAGSLAGTIAALVTTPFDVVKTYQQIDLAGGVSRKTPFKIQNSMISIMLQIISHSGLKGLFVGLVPRLVRVAPACAIMVTTFEYGKKFFETYNMTQQKSQEVK